MFTLNFNLNTYYRKKNKFLLKKKEFKKYHHSAKCAKTVAVERNICQLCNILNSIAMF